MPLAWLCQIDAFARDDGAASAIRLASHDDDRLCHLNTLTWWPAIARLPTLTYDFFDGAFGGEIVTPSGRAELSIAGVPDFASLMLHGARIRWWSGELGAAWGSFTLRFDGMIDNHPAVRDGMASVEFRVDDRWLDDPILSTFAGTTGAEGEAAQKGQVKPLLLGAPRMVAGVLIDSIDTIVQLNDGPIEGVEVAFEDAARFAAPVADYASFAALDGATIAPGLVATGLAVGMVRHGAPGDGVLTYDVKGSNSGSDGGGWVRRAGAMVKRLAARQGKLAKVDTAALTALDTARPWNISIALTAQTTMRELVQSIAQSVNAVALVTWTGLLTILPIDPPEGATPVGTLASDGSALPPVARVDQLSIATPWWRVAIEAEVTQRVHGSDEIRFTALLVDRGRYADGESYREGHIVDLADGSRWLYINPVPTIGNDPPVWPDASNAYWSNLTPPTVGGKVFVQPTAPTAAESTGGDKWLDANGKYWRRVEDITLTIAGEPIEVAGETLEIVWTDNEVQPVLDALREAADAQADADAAAVAAANANEAIADIASDDVLTAGEKPRVIQDVAVITAEQAGIDASATNYGITTEKTAYDNAVAALTAYLATLTAPVAWNVLTGNTTIIGATFRSNFQTVYSTRQALLDRIAEEAGERADWDGISGGGKPEDNADVTSQIEGPANVNINADFLGTTFTPPLPRTVTLALFRNGVDITASCTWTIDEVVSGTIVPTVTAPGTISLAADGGVLTTSRIRVKAVYGSITRFFEFTATRVDAPAPIGGGGSSGSTASTSTWLSLSSTSQANVMAGTGYIEATAGASGRVDLAAPLSYAANYSATGTYDLYLQWQRWNGSSWVNIGSEVLANPLARLRAATLEEISGAINVPLADTGLTTGSSYRYRLVGRVSNNTTRARYIYGTASAVGS